MDNLSIAAQLILSLSILVVLHECGHFFPARWFKTRVEKFYLFFNPGFSLFKKKIGETEYGIGWIPFGGYVKISGMIDESMDLDQMKEEPKPWEFRSKKAWQRLIIMVGGVTVNFILGFLIFAGMLFYWGKSYIPADQITHGIYVDSIASEIGLREGDRILSVGDRPFERFDRGPLLEGIVINDAKFIKVIRDDNELDIPVDPKWASFLTKNENKNVELIGPRILPLIKTVSANSVASKMGLQEGDQLVSINNQSTPFQRDFVLELAKYKEQDISVGVKRGLDTLALNGELEKSGRLGIRWDIPEKSEKYTLLSAIPAGVNQGMDFLTKQLKAFGQMFKGRIKATESLGSVFSIANMFDPGWNWRVFWSLTASLSILLGFFNLLPIPALDGGYIMFLLYEVISGRKPDDKFMEYATYIGFFLMVGLMIFAIGLDVSRMEFVDKILDLFR